MSEDPKYFKRQSGKMEAVSVELRAVLEEAQDILDTVRSTMPPPSNHELNVVTLPPPPLPMTPLSIDKGPKKEAGSVYSFVNIPRPEIRPIKPTVHAISWSGQPDLQFLCTKDWSTPAWESSKEVLPRNVYQSDDGRLYTFEPALVTCKACRGV